MMNININCIQDVEFGGIDMSDYPKFCDAYIESATIWSMGEARPATEAEIEEMESDGCIFYELLSRYIH